MSNIFDFKPNVSCIKFALYAPETCEAPVPPIPCEWYVTNAGYDPDDGTSPAMGVAILDWNGYSTAYSYVSIILTEGWPTDLVAHGFYTDRELTDPIESIGMEEQFDAIVATLDAEEWYGWWHDYETPTAVDVCETNA